MGEKPIHHKSHVTFGEEERQISQPWVCGGWSFPSFSFVLWAFCGFMANFLFWKGNRVTKKKAITNRAQKEKGKEQSDKKRSEEASAALDLFIFFLPFLILCLYALLFWYFAFLLSSCLYSLPFCFFYFSRSALLLRNKNNETKRKDKHEARRKKGK